MSDKRSLFYGFTDPTTIHRNGTNGFIRVNGTFDNASKTISNITDQGSFFNINYVIPGQRLIASTFFPSATIVTAVDTVANTITVEDFPAQSGNGMMRISPAETQYFVEEAVLTAPTQNAIQNFQGITGSEDTEYSTDDRKWGVLGIQATTSSNGTPITGEFALYEITRVYNRRSSNSTADFYISSSVGILKQKPDLTLSTTNDRLPTVQLSETSSFPPIFDVTTVDQMPGGGVGFSGYPLAIPDLIDRINTGSGGSGGDTFPFTGSAVITGSLTLAGDAGEQDFFLVRSASFTSFKISSSNVPVFGAFTTTPTAVAGGFMYSASNFYAGIE